MIAKENDQSLAAFLRVEELINHGKVITDCDG